MSAHGSVTGWIDGLRQGDPRAAERLWQRYFVRLAQLCGRKLGERPRRVADEEDAAAGAMASLFRGIEEGRFPLLSDRDNLWHLLVSIAAHKVSEQCRREARQKRGGGKVAGESAFAQADSSAARGIDQAIGDEPTPELAASVAEQYTVLLERLPEDKVRAIAEAKLQGYSNEEIAQQLNCSLRTVERKLGVIRSYWSTDLPENERKFPR